MRVVDVARRRWLTGLNQVRANELDTDLRGWIGDARFQVYADADSAFTLNFDDTQPLARAFASEIARMSNAVAESLAAIQAVSGLPRSTAWAIVQWYYSAFYAAHAILRFSGEALVQLERGHANDVNRVAGLFGMQAKAKSGFHHATIDVKRREITFTCRTGDGGSHEVLWMTFERWLQWLEAEVLYAGVGVASQDLSNGINRVRLILNRAPATRGAWLSIVRNRVSYRHELGAWHPYDGQRSSDHQLYRLCEPVPRKAEEFAFLADERADDISAFLFATRFVVALAHDMALEMSARAEVHPGFAEAGMLRVIRLRAAERT